MKIQEALSDDVRGNTPLWVVFWIYGVLISHLFFGAILLLKGQVEALMLGMMLAGFVAYTAWIMRSVWVNAMNVGNEIYGHIARALTVAWSLNAVLVSVFLLLGHFGAVTLPI